jgi:hypothetical protein
MTREELRQVAVAQNDDDHAAGKLPSRYVEDIGVLAKVAALLTNELDANGGGGRGEAA